MATDRASLEQSARTILEGAWRQPGYCVPNPTTYPRQWLWDSCFHAIVWAELGESERALSELRSALAHQGEDGFVPHLTYHDDPDVHRDLWRRRVTSCITQPPIYAHALAELARRGVDAPPDLVERAARGVRHLVDVRPRHESGLIAVLHPWETGCDDSPRWDGWGCAHDQAWYKRKGELVASLVLDPATEAPMANPDFRVGAAGFTALVAHAAAELLEITGDVAWSDVADELVSALTGRWDPDRRTWTEAGPNGPIATRTVDALLPLLVTRDSDVVAVASRDLLDDAAYGGVCGPAGVHRDEPSFEPARYWRGGAWPQLTYLLWVAARRCGDQALASGLSERLVRGAERSGFAEHWHPDTGAPGGAVPQTWTTLAVVVASSASS